MTKLKQVYKCQVCENIVEVVHDGQGQLACCSQPMQPFEEKTEEEGNEKHKPVIEQTENGILVKIGSTPHPMEEAHYIEWIELIVDGKSCRIMLKPEDQPQAEFCLTGENISARAFCNIHDLWINKQE